MIDYQYFLKTELPNLLAQLKAEQKPIWGKMSAQHMVEHLSSVVLLSNGRFAWTRPVATEIGDALRESLFVRDEDFPKNLRVPAVGEEPAPLRFPNLEEAKARFLAENERFFTFFEENPTARPVHPVFGELNFEEWKKSHTVHARHHFKQFGLIE